VGAPRDQRLGVWWIAQDHPDLPAIAASPDGTVLTFGELAARAHRLVHALQDYGLQTGDVVAYALPNGADIVCWQLALQESGLAGVSLNPALTGGEVRTILEHSAAACVVADHAYRDIAALSDASAPLQVSVGGEMPSFTSYDDLVSGYPTTIPGDRSFGTPIYYSSGTTGLPKAVARKPIPGDPAEIANSMAVFGRAFGFTPLSGCHLVSAGMHHGGCQGFYLGALNVGQALVILGGFDPEATLAAIDRHRITTAYMVPTQFVRLLRLPEPVRTQYDLTSLEVVAHSAAPCPLDVKKAMFDWWGPVIWETYGGAEGAAAIAKPHRWLERPGTVGRAVRGVTIRVLDDDGNDLPAGESGNVYIETDRRSFEYRDDPELTASVHRGTAFTLGDIGYLDDDGYLFLRDRAKDMVISGGVNIYPAEIEAVLGMHPSVADVAVIGLPDPEWGESVYAVVELVTAAEPSPELASELIAHCRSHLAGYKCPRAVDFRAELPRTDTGKLLKRLLREEYVSAELHR
jgi:long-chain acyl-CoA synthetase